MEDIPDNMASTNVVSEEEHTEEVGVQHNDNPLSDDIDEQRVYFAAIDSFHQYRAIAHQNCTHRRRQNLYALPASQWQLLAGPPINLLETLSQIDDAIDSNADLQDAITSFALSASNHQDEEDQSQADDHNEAPAWLNTATSNDHGKAHSTLRQFYRDWTRQGFLAEAKPLLDLILPSCRTHLSLPTSSQKPSLLLPGAGLGRLIFELTLAGYNATGNEISYHQLLASNYILNACPSAHHHTIYPFVASFTNLPSRASQLASFPVPDIHPATATREAIAAGKVVGEMSMTSGDFILSYSDPASAETFDAVISVYFIDTAPNLFRYIHTVRNTLKEDGLWINVGPLLWHFDGGAGAAVHSKKADGDDGMDDNNDDDGGTSTSKMHRPTGNPKVTAADSGLYTKAQLQSHHQLQSDTGIAEPGSFELSNDEVLFLLSQSGFEILHSEILPAGFDRGTHDDAAAKDAATDADGSGKGHDKKQPSVGSYIQDPTSMLQNRYRCAHWVARKTRGWVEKPHGTGQGW